MKSDPFRILTGQLIPITASTQIQMNSYKNLFLQAIRGLILGTLMIFSVIALYRLYGLLFGGGFIMGTVWLILDMFWWMLKKVFFATIPYLLPPIAVYCVICWLTSSGILRFLAGVGSIYLFYTLSDNISFSLSGVMGIVKLAFQLYLLIVLVVPEQFMAWIGAVACTGGALFIYIFPDLPGTLDDMAAICTLIMMVFIYLNVLASWIKLGGRKAFFIKK